jgi:hypothetical protein
MAMEDGLRKTGGIHGKGLFQNFPGHFHCRQIGSPARGYGGAENVAPTAESAGSPVAQPANALPA